MLAGVGVLVWWLHREGLLPLPERPSPSSSSSPGSKYDRKDWPHWSDADGDCQDTRQEVLIAESEIPVKFKTAKRCRVKSGRWRCPYTGRTFTDPRDLDVDHLVPLAEAHRSGGHAWDRDQRERYANALEDPDHLIAVEKGSNRAKGDKDPHAWMPPDDAFRCEYLKAWRGVKDQWMLEMDPAETRWIEEAEQACAKGLAPELPPSQKH